MAGASRTHSSRLHIVLDSVIAHLVLPIKLRVVSVLFFVFFSTGNTYIMHHILQRAGLFIVGQVYFQKMLRESVSHSLVSFV